jgi:hypothetical protein
VSAATVVCNPVIHKFEVREAGAGIGMLYIKTNVCMSGSRMKSSSGSVAWDPNPLGSMTGWTYKGLGTARTATGTNVASWQTTGVFKLCVPIQVSPLCSYGETFKVLYAGYARSFVGPPAPPRFSCTNAYCRKAMTFAYKGRG